MKKDPRRYSVSMHTSQGVVTFSSSTMPSDNIGGYKLTRVGNCFYYHPADGSKTPGLPINFSDGEGYVFER